MIETPSRAANTSPASCGGDQGALSIFIAVIAFAVIVFLGAIVDLDQQLQALHDANIAAEEAARAAAGRINHDRAYSSGQIVIDHHAAVRAAADYLRHSGYTGAVTAVSDNRVQVNVTITRPAVFLPLIGIHVLRADASAVANLAVDGAGDQP